MGNELTFRLHDIAIGAPFHTDYTSDAFETGCVYIDYQQGAEREEVIETHFNCDVSLEDMFLSLWKTCFLDIMIWVCLNIPS